jgi:hypothetical protein
MAFLSNGSGRLCSGKDGNSTRQAIVLVVSSFFFGSAKTLVVRMGDLGILSSLPLASVEAGLRSTFASSDPGDSGIEILCWC